MVIQKVFYIDGFNLYHSIKAMIEGDSTPGMARRPEPQYIRYKWLDLYKLCSFFVDAKKHEQLTKIYYFTAYAFHISSSLPRHLTYVKALKTMYPQIEVVLGKFKKTTKTCNATCKLKYQTFEEKETDVNIAVGLQDGAFTNEYDTAVLISADSDLVPAVQISKRTRRIEVVMPIGRISNDLTNAAHQKYTMSEHMLKSSQLPDTIPGTAIRRPVEWA